jgi:transcription antitermination factor NusG
VSAKRRTASISDHERQERMNDAHYWHLLRTAPNRVDDARLFLEDLGVAVAQPVANAWKRAGRGWKIRHVPVRRRAFDGYLFVGVRGTGLLWSALDKTGYFRAVVGFGMRPAIIERVTVDVAMARAAKGEFDEVAPGRLKVSEIQKGDTAKLVNAGSYTGLSGPVDEVGEKTAMVLLDMLGGPRPMEFPISHLVRVV